MFSTRKEWISANPLRKWLTETGMTVTDLAAMIGRNPSTIHIWMRGAITPVDSFWKLVIAMKNPGIEEDWKDWEDSQPGKIP